MLRRGLLPQYPGLLRGFLLRGGRAVLWYRFGILLRGRLDMLWRCLLRAGQRVLRRPMLSVGRPMLSWGLLRGRGILLRKRLLSVGAGLLWRIRANLLPARTELRGRSVRTLSQVENDCLPSKSR